MNFSFSAGNGFMQSLNQIPNTLTTTKKVSPKAASFIALALSIVFIAVGVFSIIRGDQTKDWPTVNGKVSSSNIKRSASNDSNNSNNIEYDIVAGYTVNGNIYATRYTSSRSPVLGEEVKIKYNPSNPSDAQTGDVSSMGWIFSIVGGVLAIIAVVMFVKAKPNDKTQEAAQTIQDPNSTTNANYGTVAPSNSDAPRSTTSAGRLRKTEYSASIWTIDSDYNLILMI